MKCDLLGRTLVAALLGSCLAGVLSAAEGDEAFLRRRLAQFDREAGSGNLDAMMELFSDDAVVLGAGQAPLAGKESIRAWWKGILDQFKSQEVHEVGAVTSIGETVVLQGSARGTFVPNAGGSAVQIDSWFLHVYRRKPDGSLRLWRGAFGPNAPAAQSR